MKSYKLIASGAFGLACFIPPAARAQFFTDSGSPANPAWSTIYPTLNYQSADPGPVYGSAINVNNAAVEVGLYGNRPISVSDQRIHVCCNTSSTNFTAFTRWFQTDGNTQVIRLFVNDDNTATTRVGSARCEAFNSNGWNTSGNVTYEWTGRYTIARRREGFAIMQVKNDVNDWAVQLSLTSTGSLIVNNRRNLPDVTLKNPDGSVRNFDGEGFDVRVLDDGHDYKLWIDGILLAENFYDRPTADTSFRWGSYCGDNIISPPADYSLILVSGVQVKSWPGNLSTATTAITKANNTQNLGNTASWSGGVVPGIHRQAVWNSTVTAANTTTLNTDLTWAGIRITSPGGLVTINGSATLALEESGLDMATATRSLEVNCPLELNATAPWVIAGGQSATFSGAIRGYAGISLSGGGTLYLDAANKFTGPTTVGAGALVLSHASALSSTTAVTLAGGTLLQPTIGGATITAPITLGASGTTASISAPTNNPGTQTPTTLTLGGAIGGAGNVTFTGSGTSNTINTVLLSAKGSFAGTTRLDTSGADPDSQIILKLGIANALPPTTILTIDGGNGVTSTRFAELNLNGFNQQLAGLTNVTGLTLRGQRIVNSDVSAPATLTVNNIANHTFSGNLGTSSANGSVGATPMPGSTNGNNFGLTKAGSGIFTLAGAATYTGATIINAGTLAIGASNVLPDATPVSIGNATLNAGTFADLTGTLNVTAGATINFGAGAALAFANSSALSWGGTLNLTGTFVSGSSLRFGTSSAGLTSAQLGRISVPGFTALAINSTGFLIATPEVGYSEWKTANNTTQAIDLDHDKDGVANGIESFLGGNGITTGFTPLPAVAESGGIFSITWKKGTAYTGSYGIHYFVETSATLDAASWTTEALGGRVSETGGNVKYTFPAGTKRFARLKVVDP